MTPRLVLIGAFLLAGCCGEPSPPFAQLYRIGDGDNPFKGYIVGEWSDVVDFKTCEGNVLRIKRTELILERGKC